MSGIGGIFFLDSKPVDSLDLEKMIKSLAHRGPDRSGIWVKECVGLGQCMLLITPESMNEHLPLEDPDREIVITADARIDNRDELISLFHYDNCQQFEISDSQLILHAYKEWGKACPERLVGDFAFVIWDGQQQQMFCARDQVGVKPFYYYLSGNSFIFASEIKALLQLPYIHQKLNEVRVADHLVQFFEDKTITFFNDIYRLPPAHTLVINSKSVAIHSYWDLDPHREIRYRSDDEYSDAFREIFTESVRCRLRSAGPVGSALSGGLDSSSIACTTRNILFTNGAQPIHTFSAIFPSLPEPELIKIDERSYIKSVLKTGGFASHYIYADQINPLLDPDTLFYCFDEVYFAPNLSMHWALHQAASQQDIRVFLDGTDGDATVSHGLEYLSDLLRLGKWMTLYKESSAISKRDKSYGNAREILWRYGIKPLIPNWVLNKRRDIRGDKKSKWVANSIINPDFARRIEIDKRISSFLDDNHLSGRSAWEEHWCNLKTGTISLSLELLDKISSSFSIESRYPFFDRRLIEFCLALPASQKLNEGWTRIIQRRAMAGSIPDDVCWRTSKADFNHNFSLALQHYDREIIERIVYSLPETVKPYIDVLALQTAYKKYFNRPSQSVKYAYLVYGAVIFALWTERTKISV